jgi:hypothetical protein
MESPFVNTLELEKENFSNNVHFYNEFLESNPAMVSKYSGETDFTFKNDNENISQFEPNADAMEQFAEPTAGILGSSYPSADQLIAKGKSYFDDNTLLWHYRLEQIAHNFVYKNSLSAEEKKLILSWGYKAEPIINGPHDFQMQAYVPTNSNNYPVLAFRGTSGFLDVLTDANIEQVGLGQFFLSQNIISQKLAELQRNSGKKVYVTGHSLGGALAQIAAVHNLSLIYSIVTFQSPGILYKWAGKIAAYNNANSGKIYSTHHRVNFDVVDMAGQSFSPGYVFKHYLGIVTPITAHTSFPVSELVKKIKTKQASLTLDIRKENIQALPSSNLLTEIARKIIITALTGPIGSRGTILFENNHYSPETNSGNINTESELFFSDFTNNINESDETNRFFNEATRGQIFNNIADVNLEFNEINATIARGNQEVYEQGNRKDSENELADQNFENFAPAADPVLFYEDVKVRSGETLIGLAAEYGFDLDDWREIWKDPKNADLLARRKLSTELREGDILQIPVKWRITSKKLEPADTTFKMTANRSGKEGLRLDWVQTVYGGNQPNFPTGPFPAFSVDLPTEDDNPFYWTQKEYDHLVNDFEGQPVSRTKIKDRPNRNTPTAAMGDTTWRAVTSLCVVTHKRVSIWNTFVWGINFKTDGKNEPYNIRLATNDEINGHLNLLRKKTGKSKKTYTEMGWVFRNRNT